MSYILDAIRKSDQQRQHGATPTLLTAHGIAAAPASAAILPYSVVAAVLIAAGIAIGWLRPWQDGPQATVATVVASPPPQAQVAIPQVQVPAERNNERAQQIPALRTVPGAPAATISDTAKASAPALVPVPAREASSPAIPTVAKDTAPGTATAKASGGPVPATTTQEKTVTTLSELPPAIQQEIPRMLVSVHAYSATPANRLVSINDQLLREGDTLAPGIRLDEITVDGMIFSYKGFRFRTGPHGPGPSLSRP